MSEVGIHILFSSIKMRCCHKSYLMYSLLFATGCCLNLLLHFAPDICAGNDLLIYLFLYIVHLMIGKICQKKQRSVINIICDID